MSTNSENWTLNLYRLLHLDTHFDRFKEIYTDFDADKTARMYRDLGFQMVSFMAFDGPSYYPTRIGRIHPGLKGDFFRDFSTALRKYGIRCVAYVSFGDMAFDYGKLEREGIPRLLEILDWYDVDGFFLDGPGPPYLKAAAYGEHCRRLYAQEVGGEFPSDDRHANAFAFRRWANGHLETFMKKVYDAVAEIKPDIVVIYNGHCTLRYPVSPGPYVKLISWDPATPKGGGLYSSSFSLQSRYLSALPGTCFAMQNVRGRHWFEFSLREPETFFQESALLLAGCGKTYLCDNPHPSGRPLLALMDIFRDVNRRTEALEPYIVGCRPVKDVAVLHSADSVWSKAPFNPFASQTLSPAYHSVTGAHKALVEGHVQFLIPNSEVLVNTIGDYNAVILADQPILTENECRAIRDFVAGGGALVATGETGTRDTDNRLLENFALADVLGVDYLGTSDTKVGYLRFPLKVASCGIPAADIPVTGRYVEVRAGNAKQVVELVGTYEDDKDGYAASAEHAAGPGVTINTFGQGKALYCAVRPFDAYHKEDIPNLRKIGLWLLDLVYPPEKRKIVLENTPLNVELFYNKRGDERFVHLINFSADRREGVSGYVQDFQTIRGIKVRVRLASKPESVTAVPEEKKVDWKFKSGWLSFKAKPLAIHSVYRIIL